MEITNLLAALSVSFVIVAGYNVSPVPNMIFKEPANKWSTSKHQKSFFGLTVHLKQSTLFVGAPKAAMFSRRYNAVGDSGAVYNCSVLTGHCVQHTLLTDQNFVSDALMAGQYFGASMDGLPDKDLLVACTPRLTVGKDRHAVTGACYTSFNGSVYNQRQALKYYKYGSFDSAMEGFAVHVFRDNKYELRGVLTGMPDYDSVGSVFIYGEDLEKGIFLNSSMLEENGYFGYSVNTIIIGKKSIYVVGAPRSGKVYVFEISKVVRNLAQMSVHMILSSGKFGDYFGYSLCTEDVNRDGLADVMVGAPFQSSDTVSDTGAVYVYLNRGLDSSGLVILEQQVILVSEYRGSGQFGYSISVMGDLNHDEYNDIAVGSPFEGNGAVYIFHGSSTGLLPKPSQVLKSPTSTTVQSMFGAAIAKAVDIDANKYSDIAVGSPNDDVVHLFRTYPLIRPFCSVTFSKEYISIENATVLSEHENRIEDEVSVEVCYSYKDVHERKGNKHYDFRLTLQLDPPFRRSKIGNESSHEIIVQISREISCINLEASIRASFRHLAKPITAILNYSIVHQNTASKVFCDECVIQELVSEQIANNTALLIFKPDCEEDVCLTDLKLRVKYLNFRSPFILNSTRTFELQYQASNEGESSYGTLLEIIFSRNISIVKAMDFCEIGSDSISCLINNGQALQRGKIVIVNITLSATDFDGSSLDFEARLFGDGNETFTDDNFIKSFIELVRHSTVSIAGTYNPSYLNGNAEQNVSIDLKFLLDNYGPSNIQNANVTISIPVLFKQIPLIDLNSTDLKISYAGNRIEETVEFTDFNRFNKSNHIIQRNSSMQQLVHKKGTILNCSDEFITCTSMMFLLEEFPALDEPVRIELKMTIFPHAMTNLMPEDVETLSLYVDFDIGVPSGAVTLITSGSLVLFRTIQTDLLWVYVTSAAIGLAVLMMITRAMYKRNFFKRMTLLDMEQKLNKASKSILDEGSIMMVNEPFPNQTAEMAVIEGTTKSTT
ncbi:integrin alpha-PS5-like isoform X1 [Armigeres subalbatus]|uniref:integrin alpha-PS5-like isoform X1 n=1 Tax=Armigeres subalbatus TaxID=124917 RepID=UPI002ED2D4DA